MMIQNEKVREALIDVYNRCFDTTDDVDVLAEYISELEARIPQWISVKDRLPEDGDEVLFFVMDWVMKGKYCKQVPHWEAYLSGGSAHYHKNNGIEHVTHWMPLPEPPKESE